MKKGFTLVELLAVVVILAIISLITIPQLAKVVNNVKESANLRSLEGHINNIDNNMAIDITRNDYSDGTYTFSSLNFSRFPVKDKIRCESYELNKAHVVSATNCQIASDEAVNVTMK